MTSSVLQRGLGGTRARWCKRGIVVAFAMMACGLAACVGESAPESGPPKLLDERNREPLEIALFNEYVMREHEWGGQDGRGYVQRARRIAGLAAQGLEIAAIAQQLLDFEQAGRLRASDKTIPAWRRLGVLAAQGDGGAQCLFALLAGPLGPLHEAADSPAAAQDRFVLAPKYLQRSAEQGQSMCRTIWTARTRPDDHVEQAKVNLAGAKKACALCQSRLADQYQSGEGLAKDLSKALCWADEATRAADSPQYAGQAQRIVSGRGVQRALGETVEPLVRFRPGTACSEPIGQMN